MKNSKFGNISSYESLGTLDGSGVRFIVFMQGCNKRCQYCHNPETQEEKPHNLIQSEELVQKILRYKTYFKERGGVTFSGGEPLIQADFLVEVCQRLKEENIKITLDTSGYFLNDSVRAVLQLSDCILLDIKGLNEEETRQKCRSSYREFQEMIQYLEEIQKETIIRCVIIPNQNDHETYLDSMIEILSKYSCVKEIELLGFNTLAKDKYAKMNLVYPMEGTKSLEMKRLKELQEYCDQKFNG